MEENYRSDLLFVPAATGVFSYFQLFPQQKKVIVMEAIKKSILTQVEYVCTRLIMLLTINRPLIRESFHKPKLFTDTFQIFRNPKT